MKQVIVFLIAFMLITSFCKSQTTSGVVTGNYIGQSVADRMVMSIEVKKGQKYLLKTYDLNKKLQKKVKGKWTIEGDKLVLKGNSGTIMILEKYKDTWYLADKNGRVCLARFYQNKTPNEFWTQLRQGGC